MAQGDANKVWLIPSDFNKSLEGFARMLGTKGDDGVFRYEPPKDDDVPASRAGDIDDDVADWFDGTSAQEVAAAVAQVEREASVTIAQQEAARLATYRGEVPSAERPAIRGTTQAQPQTAPEGEDDEAATEQPQRQQAPYQGGPPPGQRPQNPPPNPQQGPPPGYQPPPGYPQQPPGYQQPPAWYRPPNQSDPGQR